MPLKAGARLGPYEVVGPLGAGGMGEVYRATDTRLGRQVAVKVLPEHLARDEEALARLEREARAVAGLSHPGICTLHDVGHEGEVSFLVMELLEGETLAERLTRGPLPLDQVFRLGAEIGGALAAAHERGIAHRDLKPGNVMLTRAGVKLLDFGLARALEPTGGEAAPAPTASVNLTQEGTLLGTLPYMAPEQLEGRRADHRSDIFALGAVLHEMATGQRAFSGRSQASLISAILASQPPPVSSFQPLSPPGLDQLVRTCLAKEPDQRWQSARDVVLQLRALAEAPLSVATSGSGAAGRTWLGWGVAVLAVVLWLGSWLRGPRAEARPPERSASSCRHRPAASSAPGRRRAASRSPPTARCWPTRPGTAKASRACGSGPCRRSRPGRCPAPRAARHRSGRRTAARWASPPGASCAAWTSRAGRR